MSQNHNYYVYIIASINRVIYVGVTNDLLRRILQHKLGMNRGFTKKYHCKKLVYYEHFYHIEDAIRREKELKGWKRQKKITLIEEENPNWKDLFDDIIEFSKMKRYNKT